MIKVESSEILKMRPLRQIYIRKVNRLYKRNPNSQRNRRRIKWKKKLKKIQMIKILKMTLKIVKASPRLKRN